jgi:hypothetical protein
MIWNVRHTFAIRNCLCVHVKHCFKLKKHSKKQETRAVEECKKSAVLWNPSFCAVFSFLSPVIRGSRCRGLEHDIANWSRLTWAATLSDSSFSALLYLGETKQQLSPTKLKSIDLVAAIIGAPTHFPIVWRACNNGKKEHALIPQRWKKHSGFRKLQPLLTFFSSSSTRSKEACAEVE